jgi:long-chain acyl-CoA synthetase
MAQSGEVITYAELDRRSTRLAHVLRAHGLARLDHYAIFMENNARYIECCAAGARAGCQQQPLSERRCSSTARG